MSKAPEYFDYLHEYGEYLASHFVLKIEYGSLEADISHYRRIRRNEMQYWQSAVYIRKLIERIANRYLEECNFVYDKELGKKLISSIRDGNMPSEIGYMLLGVNEYVREGAHDEDEPYPASDLEEALVELDQVFRKILKSDGKPVSDEEVEKGTCAVLLARSETIEEKAELAALLTGNDQLKEDVRAANARAEAAENDAREARKRAERAELEAHRQTQEATEACEQLSLELQSAQQSIKEQEAELSEREVVSREERAALEERNAALTAQIAALSEQVAKSESMLEKMSARLAEAHEQERTKVAAAAEAAEEVSELEERLDGILSEHDFIKMLLERPADAQRGDASDSQRIRATDEQRRIVNFLLNPKHTSRLLNVRGEAGTGKTLCLLAAVINYLEPKGQSTLSFGGEQTSRRALFVCFNKDLASYIKGLLERFPQFDDAIEVANYDQYLNQLVRNKPFPEYGHLSQYASDVRLQPKRDANGRLHYWNLLVRNADKENYIRQAIMDARKFYQDEGRPDLLDSPYLDYQNRGNVRWMMDEIDWLESRYHSEREALDLYPGAERVGRGGNRKPRRNSVERTHVTNVLVQYREALNQSQRYTLQQTVQILLRSKHLPTYDVVAIDEAQDLNMLHIELFARLRTNDGFLLIAADEGQRLYPRDFSWKQLDGRARPITLPLSVNMRNPIEIRLFAERLKNDAPANDGPAEGKAAPDTGGIVQVRCEPWESTVAYVKELASHKNETTAVVTSQVEKWESRLESAGVCTEETDDHAASDEMIRMSNGNVRPGVYCFSQLRAKGLEFDNVIVDYDGEIDRQDEERERRIRYVQFTRARKTLLVRYEGVAPRLLRKYYADYLADTTD